MARRGAIVALLAVLTTVTAMLLAGHGPWSGDTLWALDEEHGLNTGDLVPLAAWAVGIVCGVVLWRRTD